MPWLLLNRLQILRPRALSDGFRCLILACLLVMTVRGWALEMAPDFGARSLSLAAAAEVLEDPEGQLDWPDLDRPEVRARFQPVPHPVGDLNFGFTASTYWVRLNLAAPAGATSDYLLEVPYASLDHLDVWVPGRPPWRTGSQHPMSSRAYPDHFFVFPVHLGPEPVQVYLRVQSNYALTLPLYLWQAERFQVERQNTLILQFLYYGGLLALLSYNLFLYLSLHDRRFLFYSLYAATFGLGIFAGNGYGRMVLWPDAAHFDEFSQNLLLALAAVFLVQFSREFLQTQTRLPRCDRLLKICGGGFGILSLGFFACMFWPDMPVRWLNLGMMADGLMLGASSFGIGWLALRRGHASARFFILAWCCLSLGMLVATLRAFSWLPTNGLTSYALQISSAFEMLLLAFALADLIHQERAARTRAQDEALQSHRQMLAALRVSEDQLERAVQERTIQLEVALRKEQALIQQYVRFGSMISHEFRNPLGIIDSQASLMRKERELGRDQTEKRLTIIASATRRLAMMFERWMLTDRLGHALQHLAPAPLVLTPWLQHLLELNPHWVSNHLLRTRWAPDVPAVLADASLLEMVLSNLLDNAGKYSPEGSQITLETCAKPGFGGFSVLDKGMGIAPELHADIFYEFFRVAPEGPIRGMGLGLPLVQRVVEVHGGQIELRSEVGHGSCFTVWLPVLKSSSPSPAESEVCSA